MQAPSLYSYFDSKAAIYDAMFSSGNQAFLDRIKAVALAPEPVVRLTQMADAFIAFSLEDPVRHQLLFQRTIPGFEPSSASYAGAVEVLDITRELLAGIGITSPEALDTWTALVTGLVDQQVSNDPGGDRWTRLVPEVAEMFWNHHRPRGGRRR
jgi:AcrR family transcriptional regulator